MNLNRNMHRINNIQINQFVFIAINKIFLRLLISYQKQYSRSYKCNNNNKNPAKQKHRTNKKDLQLRQYLNKVIILLLKIYKKDCNTRNRISLFKLKKLHIHFAYLSFLDHLICEIFSLICHRL